MSQARRDGCGAAPSFLPLREAVPKEQAARRGEEVSTQRATQSPMITVGLEAGSGKPWGQSGPSSWRQHVEVQHWDEGGAPTRSSSMQEGLLPCW